MVIALVVSATSGDFMWVGPMPLWACLSAAGLILAAWIGHGHGFKGPGPILLCWAGFLTLAGIVDVVRGQVSASFLPQLAFGAASLVGFAAAATLGRLIGPARLFAILLVISAAQGAVAIGQFLQVEAAVRVPEVLVSSWPLDRRVADETGAAPSQTGRARGTAQFVHKFAAFQGIETTFVLLVCLGGLAGPRLVGGRSGTYLLLLVAVAGMTATYSRSVIVGLAGALAMFLLVYNRERRGFAKAGAAALLVASLGIGQLLGLWDAANASRFAEFQDQSNAIRIETWSFAIEAFATHPFIGMGHDTGSNTLDASIHSVPLRIAAAYGIAGLIPYLFATVCLLTLLHRRARSGGDQSVIAAAAVGAFIVALADSSTHSSGFFMYDAAQPILLGLMAGGSLPNGRACSAVRLTAEEAARNRFLAIRDSHRRAGPESVRAVGDAGAWALAGPDRRG